MCMLHSNHATQMSLVKSLVSIGSGYICPSGYSIHLIVQSISSDCNPINWLIVILSIKNRKLFFPKSFPLISVIQIIIYSVNWKLGISLCVGTKVNSIEGIYESHAQWNIKFFMCNFMCFFYLDRNAIVAILIVNAY